ncbi:MAG: hypothetical protein IKY45_04670, partial [Clostridia bacterium]|nr:hypothetical protein [Clostridia bacterium]
PAPVAAPAPAVKDEDDFSDLLASAPAPVVAPAPAAAPAPVVSEDLSDVSIDDDLSDLFASDPAEEEAPKFQRAHSREGFGSNGEKLNESGSMGIAGKEDLPNDPWKDLEAQMGTAITPPPSIAALKDDLDDGMTSSYDDAPIAQTSNVEDKIDMSDYSSMLGGMNDPINSSTAQFDPTWEFKMMEGNAEDDDDEMSTDNVGFFDL